MNYKALCTAIKNLAQTLIPDAQFVSGLRQRLDETLTADLATNKVVWLVDNSSTIVLPNGFSNNLIKIGFGTRYNKQDNSTDEATKLGESQTDAELFIRDCYRDFGIIGEINNAQIAVAYEGIMFTEFVGVIATLSAINKIDCWDY
jgi:hypothetical protein